MPDRVLFVAYLQRDWQDETTAAAFSLVGSVKHVTSCMRSATFGGQTQLAPCVPLKVQAKPSMQLWAGETLLQSSLQA